jgi:O-antigen/teichoic acid export membrane protein
MKRLFGFKARKDIDTPTDEYGHVLKYTGLFGGVQGLNILIGLVRNKVVAALLGPSGMGLASLFNTTVNFISQGTNFGLSFSAVRHVSELFDEEDDERLNHFIKVVRAWSLLTALLGMLVCIALGPLLSSYTFSWGDHTVHFVMLAPAVALMAIAGGETAILKGARQLRALASIQVWNVLLSLLITVPLYYFFRQTAIVPVIVIMALLAMVLTIRYSYRLYPLRLSGSSGILGEGMEMIRLGVAFVFAGILGSGAEMLIRSYLNVVGNLDIVGLYNAGFMLTVSYGGMVFSAMETDYFPRVSAVARNRRKMRQTVNRQIEVSLLIVSPMMAALIVFMPLIIPLLFTSEFLPVVGMAQVAVFAMYLKAVSLPISYLTLARGDSVAYLTIEAIDDVLMVVFMVVGYSQWQLLGTGIALCASYLFDLILIYVYTFVRYGFHISQMSVQYMAIQFPLGLAAYIITFVDNPYIYWTLGCLICFVSLIASFHILQQKTSLWKDLRQKFLKKIRKHG